MAGLRVMEEKTKVTDK